MKAMKLMGAAALCALLGAAPPLVSAQGWKPSKPVEIVVGSAPGGSWNTDYLLSADTRKHLDRENDLLKVILTDLGLTKQQ